MDEPIKKGGITLKILNIHTLLCVGNFEQTVEYQRIEEDIIDAIRHIRHPDDADGFYLLDEKKANGVVPIKKAFIERLNDLGWKDERICDKEIKSRDIDSSKRLRNRKYFGVEWETGNISSSHRALNRIALAIRDGLLEGGILVLPSREMYRYLTDRVGNYQEIEGYFPIWKDLECAFRERNQNAIIKVIEIEHDGLRSDIPHIRKGTDGRALR